MVVAMIILGGATRLTEAGLSIPAWKPLSGIIPPLSESAWMKEFLNYQAFPEYKLKHMDIDLSGFKFIFWMEYSHRLLGRLLGLVFLLPLIGFWRNLTAPYKKRMVIMAILLVGQGVMGWYMVKSGLINNPYVSHYRLAAHLFLAILLLSFFLWTLFDFLPLKKSNLSGFSGVLHVLLMLIALTIIYGAFVAGLRAGKLYNTFPLMGNDWFPIELFHQNPTYLNFFENPVTVQWMHRWLGTLTCITAFWISAKIMMKGMWQQAIILFSGAGLQISLGIATLIYIVPVNLALLHQCGAVLLLAITLNLFYQAKRR